ncbi:hypothetical protein B0I35DRAFT_410386 [Stachybotrys elegans]|uniref:Uncharacterized protein n=1 Tax=Stachybotrys elegans TaxID=80388 RepID=A0A8K0WQR5_9HYPO|nr:hypothetical protein B0I35DRAFT_410386 [Stachybotrys elegans]
MASLNSDGILYELTLGNCQMFLGEDANLDIVSQLDGRGYMIHVLKTEHRQRTAELSSSPSSTLRGALEDIHRKSAEAVSRYISVNGFQTVPLLSTRTSRPRRNQRSGDAGSSKSSSSCSTLLALEESEVISLDGSGSSSSSDASDESDSDDDSTSLHQRRTKPVGIAAIAVRPGQAHASVGQRQLHRQSLPAAIGPIRAPVVTRPHAPPRNAGPLPIHGRPPAWTAPRMGPPIPPPPPPPGVAVSAPPGSGAGGPHKRSLPMPMPPKSVLRQWTEAASVAETSRDMMLAIHWAGHGEINVLDQCRPSMAAIRSRVVQLARTNATEYHRVTPGDLAALMVNATASIKRLRVGSTTYEVANSRDDLSSLFAMSAHFPRVEVELTVPPLPAPDNGPAPAPTPTPVSQTKQDELGAHQVPV